MYPITIFIRGLENEPIDVVKVGATSIDGSKIYFLLTPPDPLFPKGRVLSVNEKDVLVYADNDPSDATLQSIDKMIERGNNLLTKTKENYNGTEVQ